MNNGLRIKGGRFLARGFTLTELLVVVGIMTIMNLLIFANYPEFSQRLALKRTSEDIALIVRQAQAYSLGIKKPVSGDYTGFGVHFDKNKDKDNNKKLILFADTNDNKTYDEDEDEGELFQKYIINTGDVVSGLMECDSNNKCSEVGNTLDVFYQRATSMATINGKNNVSYAKITIMSPKKKTRTIEIWTSGQISVKE